MASAKYAIPKNGFHNRITYDDSNFTPVSVAKSTSAVLRRYFSGNLTIDRVSSTVLGDALRFVHNAQVGFANNLRDIDRIDVANSEDIKLAQTVDGDATVPDDEELETFRFTMLTMGMMPRVARVHFRDIEGNYLEFGFTKRGMLESPFTLAETYARLKELWRETLRVSIGVTDPNIHILKDQGVIRTKLFFETAAEMPMKNPAA